MREVMCSTRMIQMHRVSTELVLGWSSAQRLLLSSKQVRCNRYTHPRTFQRLPSPLQYYSCERLHDDGMWPCFLTFRQACWTLMCIIESLIMIHLMDKHYHTVVLLTAQFSCLPPSSHLSNCIHIQYRLSQLLYNFSDLCVNSF